MWDFAIGGGVRQLVKPRNRANSVVFSPDGALLATSGWDIKLWNAITGEEVRHFVGNTEFANSIAFSPDGAQLVSGGQDGEVQLWNVATGDEVHLLTGHSDNIYAVEFSPDSMHVATGSSDNSARLWNVATGEQVHVFLGHRGSVSSVTFSPDGKQLATGSYDGTVGLWNAAAGDLEHRFEGHTDWVNTVAFSPVDGTRLASGADDGTIRIWDVPSGSQVFQLDEPDWIRKIEFLPDGIQLASASQSPQHDGRIILWNSDTGDEIRRLEGAGHFGRINSVAFSPDGTFIVSGASDGTARLWNAANGGILSRLPAVGQVNSVTVSKHGDFVATGSWDRVKLWDKGTGDLVQEFWESAEAMAVAFSPVDGARLVCGFANGIARMYHVNDGYLMGLRGHTDLIYSVAFSPDGSLVATGSRDGTVRLWNESTGEEVGRLEGHGNYVYSVTFSANGEYLASGGRDHRIRIWDVVTGDEVRQIDTDQEVQSVSFSPDGTLLASASGRNHGFIRLWDAATGEEVHLLDSNRFGARSVAFSPDGSYIIFGAGDRTVRALRVPRIVGVTEEGPPPLAILLEQNYPNPAKSNTIISFTLPESAYVRMEVFDILGRNVTLLMDRFEVAGRHDVNFRVSDLAGGYYFYRLSTGSTSITRQMHLLK